ncbi:hypothetical protein ABZT47_07130 [Sphaerisporangium sp. NPDC005289]|uniref:TRADD-N-associated membrane domain-containing protein n=1 Tax=Sphaerisporangium sp. NPDC005289 TaxID=3155247 RepID=UPI00339F4C9A
MDGERTYASSRVGRQAAHRPVDSFRAQLDRAMPLVVGLWIFVLSMAFADMVMPTNTKLGVKIFLWASLLALAAIAANFMSRRRQEKIQETEQAREEVRIADAALREGHLELSPLWTATQSRMTFYHKLASNHAQRSFRNAEVAMLIGFLVLVFAVGLAVRNPHAAGTAAALGAISAALAAFIGRTFLRSQENAASHLHTYFDQPVRFSRYLAVERLINEMKDLEPDQRAAISGELLRTIIAPEIVPSGEPGAAAPPDHDGSRILAALGRVRRTHGVVPRKP